MARKPRAAQASSMQMQYLDLRATFLERAIARNIDIVISAVVGCGMVLLLRHSLNWMALLALFLASTFLFTVLCYAFFGNSIGKRLIGIEIVSAKTGSRPHFLLLAFRETFAQWIVGTPLIFGYLLPLFHKENAALHDLLFSTRVLRVKKN